MKPKLATRRVVTCLDDRVIVAEQGELVRARLALFVPYRPVPGDEVVLLEQAGRRFVIGVTRAGGPLRWPALDGWTLRSRGRLTITGREGLAFRAATVALQSDGEMVVRAERILERCGDVMEHTAELASTLAEEIDELVRGPLMQRARRYALRVKEVFQINGRLVRAG
jgi:hypothetical protein